MKNRILVMLVTMISGGIVGCKKKYTDDFVDPYKDIQYIMLDSLKLNVKTIDFQSATVNRVYFTGSVDKPTALRITINGLTSKAEKNITVTNTSRLDSIFWDGSQDSLYYFRANEYCVVTFSTADDIPTNNITETLNDRGEVVSSGKILDRDTLLIVRQKAVPSTQFEILPLYPLVNEGSNAANGIYAVQYDVEGDPDRTNIERSLDLGLASNNKNFPEFTVQNPDWLAFDPHRKPIRGTFGDRYFIMRGTDKLSKVTPFDNPDYYIGRFMSPNLLFPQVTTNRNAYAGGASLGVEVTRKFAGYSPEQVYFNVFVYGDGSGSQINYTVKEKENPSGRNFSDDDDEAYQYPIKLNFRGWKLFSIPYSKFVYTRQKNTETGKEYDGKYANRIKEPRKVIHVQFGLIAPKKGALGQFIIDNPVISWGGPLTY